MILPSPSSHPAGYITYLAMTLMAQPGLPWSDGYYTYYAIEFMPSLSSNFSNCSATISVIRQDLFPDNGGYDPQQTYLGTGYAPCPDNTTIRTVFSGPAGGASGNAAYITVLVNNQMVLRVSDAQPLSGSPGIALDVNRVYPGQDGLISEVDIGPWDSVNPNPVNPSTIGTTAYQNQVQIQWQPATDDANGTGIYGYSITRNGTTIVSYQPGTTFTDLTVQPAMTYTYAIQAIDFHQNVSTPTSFTVTTPANLVNRTIATPPARIGLRPTGAYWGTGSEQLDTLSGNLNHTLPILKAMGRGGSSVSFRLNYNSQVWRQDSGGTWNLGYDIGYGYGWNLMAGPITPYWSDPYTVDHYIFTDSSGAEYTLGVNTGGIWTSQEGIYLSYNPSTQTLSFPDGTYWIMGCESGGAEADIGTFYPTTIEDTNGNQLS
jgi:hypothetical protein